MQTSALFDPKKFGFFEIYGVSAQSRGKGGWASANILQTRGRGQFFAILCGRPLWTAPNRNVWL